MRNRHSRGKKKIPAIRQIPHRETWHDLNLERGMFYGEDEKGFWASFGMKMHYQSTLTTRSGKPVLKSHKKASLYTIMVWRFDGSNWVVGPEDSQTTKLIKAEMRKMYKEGRDNIYMPEAHSFPVADPGSANLAPVKTAVLRAEERNVAMSIDAMYQKIGRTVLRDREAGVWTF